MTELKAVLAGLPNEAASTITKVLAYDGTTVSSFPVTNLGKIDTNEAAITTLTGDLTTVTNNLNGIRATNGAIIPATFTVATAPVATGNASHTIYVSDGAAGAAILAFSDGTNWLRSDDRNPISAT